MAGRRASKKRLSLAGQIGAAARDGADAAELARLRAELDQARLDEILEWAAVAASRLPSRTELLNMHREARRMFAPATGDEA